MENVPRTMYYRFDFFYYFLKNCGDYFALCKPRDHEIRRSHGNTVFWFFQKFPKKIRKVIGFMLMSNVLCMKIEIKNFKSFLYFFLPLNLVLFFAFFKGLLLLFITTHDKTPIVNRYPTEKFFCNPFNDETQEFPFNLTNGDLSLSLVVPAYNEEERCKC